LEVVISHAAMIKTTACASHFSMTDEILPVAVGYADVVDDGKKHHLGSVETRMAFDA
jgi:hypothetical protein